MAPPYTFLDSYDEIILYCSSTGWEWDFDVDAGASVDSTEQNPVHFYAVSKLYTVSLTVTGPAGSDTETKTNYLWIQC